MRRPIANPEAENMRVDRNRDLSKLRMRRYRERLRAEARIQRHMEQYGVDRDRAIRQLTPVYTPEQIAADKRRRELGFVEPTRRWVGGRDPRPTRRPRGWRRRPGSTPEARLRRLKVREYRRRQRLGRDPY